MKNFEEFGLKPELLEAIKELGFESPMPVQEEVLPILLEKNTDLIALAQTGTGKTAAFGLPILQKCDPYTKGVETLILSPTRELCVQIAKDMEHYAKHIPGMRICAVYGGASIDRQLVEIARGVKVVVATPGRMLDIIRRGKITFENLHTVVFDEADEMLNMGFRDELDGILEQTPENKNTWLFSATMPKEIKAMTKHYMSDPVEITIGKRNEGAANVTHYYYMVNARDRYLALKRIIDFYPEIYSIIFCRTRRETQEVAEQLIKDGYNADALHGDLSQAQRDNAMSRFRLKNLQLLVATDVAARGLDVTNLTHVLNYNLPDDTEQYTHRSGRTGRASSTGISIAIVTSREKGRIKDIEKTLHKTFELKQIPQGEEICAKQVLFQVDRMLQVDLGENEIENYLPGIYEKLNDLSKEDLVKRFVSLEFNRFLAYYRNAPAVEDLSVSRKGDIRGDRREGERSSRSLDSRGTKTPEGWVRLFVNLGHMDGLRPQNLIGLVNDYVRDKDLKIGRIEICKTCSFMEVEDGAESKAIQALNGSMYGDRKVYVETAKPESESDREGRDSRSNSRPRRDSRSDRPERSDRSERYGRSSRSDSSDRGGYRGSDRRSSGSSSRTQRAYSASKGDRRSGSSKRRSDSDR